MGTNTVSHSFWWHLAPLKPAIVNTDHPYAIIVMA